MCRRYIQHRVRGALDLLRANINHIGTRNSLYVICTALAPEPAELGDKTGMGKRVWAWSEMRRNGAVAQAATPSDVSHE